MPRKKIAFSTFVSTFHDKKRRWRVEKKPEDEEVALCKFPFDIKYAVVYAVLRAWMAKSAYAGIRFQAHKSGPPRGGG